MAIGATTSYAGGNGLVVIGRPSVLEVRATRVQWGECVEEEREIHPQVLVPIDVVIDIEQFEDGRGRDGVRVASVGEVFRTIMAVSVAHIGSNVTSGWLNGIG